MKQSSPYHRRQFMFSGMALVVMELILCLTISACRNDKSSEPDVNAAPTKQVQQRPQPPEQVKQIDDLSVWSHPRSEERLAERKEMVRIIRDRYGLINVKVLEAMQNVPRHWFVTEREQNWSYSDMPLPIGHGQTISQPFIVAYMTSLLELNNNSKVLEVGTGSGYQAAVLTELTPKVFTIEIIEPLARSAAARLKEHGYDTIKVKRADGFWGWKEHAPFDAIIVTAAADHIPPPLIEQLKASGKMCIPVGGVFRIQNLMLIGKDSDGKVTSKSLMPVRFVPLTRNDEK